jgi:putative ABC transport system permease protein
VSFADLLRSLGGAFAHRVRAALTLLGVVVGTSAIVLLASLLHGGRAYLVEANQDASDDDVIEVHRDEPPPAQRDRTARPLAREDAVALSGAPALRGAMVSPESSFDTWARYGGAKKRVALVSAGRSTMDLYRLAIARGRPLDDEDRRQGSRVCVIGNEIHELLTKSAPIDALRIEIDGRLFTVVGVLARKPMLGATDSTYLWDRKVMIPETTYDTLYAPAHDVSRIYVRKPNLRDAERKPARAAVHGVILRRHFGVLDFALAKDEKGGTEAMILGVIEVLLLGTGVLALLASGINIMNVMLVTVSERTREIGLRRALGATRRSVLVQFLLEAATLSLSGALVGVAVGVLLAAATAAAARAAIGRWELAIPAWSIAFGVGLAVATGLVFGVLPAWRASRVAPIDALRSE